MTKKIDGKNVWQWTRDGLFNRTMEYNEKAIECFKKVIELKPQDHNPWFNLGLVYNQMENYKKAIECFEKGIAIYTAVPPENRVENPWDISAIKVDEAFVYMSISFGELGNFQKKIECLEKAIKHNPNNKRALFRLGNTYLELDNYRKAIEYCEKAVEIDNFYLYGWWALGEAYYKRGDYQKAIECLEKTLEIRPDIGKVKELLESAKRHIK